MTPTPNPSHTLIAIVVVLATFIHFPPLYSQETQPYDTCSESVKCGNIELDYPFWGFGRPDYCGHPSFQLTCQSNVPVIILLSVSYRVLDTDTSTHTITIARNDLWDTLCPQYLYNTSYNSTLFNGDNFGQENATLFYRCAANITGPGGLSSVNNSNFTCSVNETRSDGYFYVPSSSNGPSFGDFWGLCNEFITVPVIQSTVTASVSDLRSALRDGFRLQWEANNEDCDRCFRSDGRCGSNSTLPGLFVCYQGAGGNSGAVGGAVGLKKKLIIGFLSSGVVLIGMMLMIWIYRKHLTPQGPERAPRRPEIAPQKPEIANHQVEIFIKNYQSFRPKKYKYSEIKNMTNSFLEKLGQGGFGSVYKGQLPDGRLVAVKVLSEAMKDGEDFINEVASITRTSHLNIVTLIGFCYDGNKRALLYEFMPNGSLDKFLRFDDSHLDWNTLFQIAKGIARGLEYLHKGCNTRIVHFDIKPHNILLDEEFVPKISDFGLAKLCKRKESIMSITGARGTAGYMAPEVFFKRLGGASHKSDVYSYGMMVLEMTGAHKHNKASKTDTSEAYFPDWVYKQVEVGGNLGEYGVRTIEEEEIARKLMTVGLWCIQYDLSDRPPISKVVEMLEGSLESLQVPPRRFWSSPTRLVKDNSRLDTFPSSSEGLLIVQNEGEEIIRAHADS